MKRLRCVIYYLVIFTAGHFNGSIYISVYLLYCQRSYCQV
ncbi:hypothetical protein T01_3801 [Trichinella spiralis]|uniref:Uncharacterized protein n=1 Tax=Trichinella spiralis TaxID=6334 RepID=A0A0V0YTD9_TRISP|nr:hypothetical protein T01_3801 [Trichinella spiralis]